jgi:ABC-type phosphate transport system substrate-binding protein
MKKIKCTGIIMTVLAALLLLMAPVRAAVAEVIVIANNDGTAASLDAASLKNIYLGKKLMWDNSNKVVLTMLKSGSTHESFLNKYVNKTPEQFSNYWNQLLFTGAGTPPTPFNNEKELVDFVKRTRGAIGYIDSATAHDGVKVVTIK